MNIRYYFVAIAVVLTAFLSGCATPITPVSDRSLGDKHHFEKSYRVGEPQRVSVGEPMVRVKDYWLALSEAKVAVPNKTTILKWGMSQTVLEQGQEYPLRGSVRLDGKDYALVGISKEPLDAGITFAVLVTSDGSLHNTLGYIKGANFTILGGEPNYSDPTTRLGRHNREKVEVTKGYDNYELLYTGKSSGAINLTYKEYSPEGMARGSLSTRI